MAVFGSGGSGVALFCCVSAAASFASSFFWLNLCAKYLRLSLDYDSSFVGVDFG